MISCLEQITKPCTAWWGTWTHALQHNWVDYTDILQDTDGWVSSNSRQGQLTPISISTLIFFPTKRTPTLSEWQCTLLKHSPPHVPCSWQRPSVSICPRRYNWNFTGGVSGKPTIFIMRELTQFSWVFFPFTVSLGSCPKHGHNTQTVVILS